MGDYNGNRIKIYRKKNNLTQQQLSKILNVRQSTIAMWETGESMPRSEMLPRLARVFGCTIDELFRSKCS